MSKLSKFIGLLLLLVLAAIMAGCPAADDGAAVRQNYSVLSGSPGGTWYTMIGGLTTMLTDEIAEGNFSIEASGGSVANAAAIGAGEAHFSLLHALHMYEAYHGLGGNPAAEDIRILFYAYGGQQHFVTLVNTGIKTMSDLHGKTFALGTPGSGGSENSRRALLAMGIRCAMVELAFADAARALQDGHIDALGQSGAPAAGIVELAAAADIFIIPFSDAELDMIIEQEPFFSKGILSAGTYEGQDEDVPVFNYSIYFVAHKDVPNDMVYRVMEVMFSDAGKAHLASVHPQWEGMVRPDPDDIEKMGIPMHPGAIRFWEDN